MRHLRVNRDGNHKAIVDQLIQNNISVLDLAMVGGGCPDILIGFKTDQGVRCNILVELKSSNKAVIKPIQTLFNDRWLGASTICSDASSILHICDHYRKR